jgi:hypothetical protein
MGSPLELDDSWLERIKQSLNGLEFGNVQIVIHNGRIVQIERTERRRFEPESGQTVPSQPEKGKSASKLRKDGLTSGS